METIISGLDHEFDIFLSKDKLDFFITYSSWWTLTSNPLSWYFSKKYNNSILFLLINKFKKCSSKNYIDNL